MRNRDRNKVSTPNILIRTNCADATFLLPFNNDTHVIFHSTSNRKLRINNANTRVGRTARRGSVLFCLHNLVNLGEFGRRASLRDSGDVFAGLSKRLRDKFRSEVTSRSYRMFEDEKQVTTIFRTYMDT